MGLLSSLLVGKPLHILGVAVVFLLAYLVLRFAPPGAGHHPRFLLVAASG